MSRGLLKNWPDCLKEMSIEDLQGWLNVFKNNARIWGPKVAKGALKSAREVEKELSRREREAEVDA
jgi:hypothetical protein